MEEHPVMDREHTRIREENKTEAGEVRQVRPDGVGRTKMGPAGRTGRWSDEDGHGRTKMGTNPDITPPSKVQRPDAPRVRGKVLVGECGGTRQLTA